MKKEFDVIIIGGGPAGLTLASVLSQNNKVCVIEKNKIGETTKSWGMFRDLARKLKIEHCVVNDKISTIEFGYFLGAKCIFKDAYCQLDEKKVLLEFKKRCNSKNAVFVENTEIRSFSRSNNKIIIKLDGQEINSDLLVDCSGASSHIVKRHNLVKDYSSNSILGYNVENIRIDPKKFIWEIIETPDYNEIMIAGIMPYSSTKAQVHIFPYLKNKKFPSGLAKEYLVEYLKSRPELESGEIISETKGDILMGELKKNALDNVFFFGESALWTPVFVGTGFNTILNDYEKVGKELNKLVEEKRLSEKYLSQIKPLTQDKRMVHFLKCFERVILSLKNKHKSFNEFFTKLDSAPQDFGKYFMRNKYNAEILKDTWKRIHEHFSIPELLKILPKKDILYLMELGTELLEDSILKKYRKHLEDI